MNQNLGSTFDSWLQEEGIYEEVTTRAIKRVLARQVQAAMLGLNLLGGVGWQVEGFTPYVQGKVLISDDSEAVLEVGLRF